MGLSELQQVIKTEFAGLFYRKRIGTTERVTVILNEPEVMLAAECKYGGDIKGIAKTMSDHHRLSLAGGIGGFQQLGTDVTGRRVIIDKDRHSPLLNDWCNGCRKTSGSRDHLVTRLNPLMSREL